MIYNLYYKVYMFVSDFSLFPIQKLGRPGWEYRKATWPQSVESEVHKLYNKEITGPILYDRPRMKDGLLENCKICRHNDEIHVEPGNGYNFLIRIDSLNNVNVDVVAVMDNDNNNDDDDNDKNLQNLECVICLTNNRTHIIKECNHLLLCQDCAVKIFNADRKCPLCRKAMLVPAQKVYF